MLSITEFLNLMPELKASDLFVTADKKPMFKLNSGLESNKYMDLVTEEEITNFRNSILSEEQKKHYARYGNVDASYMSDKRVKFRINFFISKSKSELVARILPIWNFSFRDLGLPKALETLCDYPSGLIIVCGAAGAGKTVTISAMLDYINENYKYHISTIEDPIEYVHTDKNSLISQREIGTDVLDFETALNNVLRVSPNVIIVGEMRSIESIDIAISAAMSGHLVITTMHTGNVIQCLQRISSSFSDTEVQRILLDLSLCLRGIVAQRLVKKQDGSGKIPAVELLNVTPLISKYIANGAISDIEDGMRSSSEDITVTFDRYLAGMKNNGSITFEEAYQAATNKDEFNLIIEGMETGVRSLKASKDAESAFDSSVDMKLLLKTALYNNASDLLLTAGAKPSLRINGSIKYLESGILGSIDTKRLLFSILSRNQRAMFEENKEIDLALSLHIESKRFGNRKNSRFRVNGFYQKGNIAAAIRLVSERIPTPEELHLPKALVNIINRTSGLILVTGPTGHGKSTTLASLINQINQTRSAHIISIEDPIEYVHVNKEAIIEQREIYSDTKSYANGLKYILRQNPDIIMIGEMRDPETIAIALTAAELGHLVLSTLHTGSSYSSINRIIDSFPSEQQNQIRNQLAGSLLCVTSQRLLPSADNSFRVAAFEVLLGTTAIKALIREAKIHLIPTTIETGAKDGMITMDMALNDLYKKNLISKESMANILTDIDYTQKKS